MSCVVGMFMVRAKKRKAVMIRWNAVVSDAWWFVSSWVDLCMMYMMRTRSVRGYVGCCMRVLLTMDRGIVSGGE